MSPQPPRKPSRLLLAIGGLVLLVVVILFIGLNLSHFSEMKGGAG